MRFSKEFFRGCLSDGKVNRLCFIHDSLDVYRRGFIGGKYCRNVVKLCVVENIKDVILVE